MRYSFISILILSILFCVGTKVSAQKSDYMYNVEPGENAKRIDIGLLVDDKQREFCYDGTGTVDTIADADIAQGVVRLSGERFVQSPTSVLSIENIDMMSNQSVRFFIWIKGDGILAKDYQLEKVPSMTVELFDNFSNRLVYSKSRFYTRGTYPWHCYFVDVRFPNFTLTQQSNASDAKKDEKENSEDVDMLLLSDTVVAKKNECGLYVTLSNFGGGTAYFAGLSYTILMDDGKLPREKRLNSYYGSYSPNPAYDDLATQVFFGLDKNVKWRFLEQNHLKNLKNSKGIREYVKENGNDWFNMQYGVAKLPYVIYCCNQYKQSSSFDADCGEALLDEVNALQDKKTGLWTIGGVPNLLVSAAVVRGIYSPKSLTHSDLKSVDMPWNGATDKARLQYADKIVSSLINARISKQIPVWNEFAFQNNAFLDQNDVQVNEADFDSTIGAMIILARALEQLPKDSEAYRSGYFALVEAYFYCIDTFMNADGTWKEKSHDKKNKYLGIDFVNIFEMTPVLEKNVNKNIEAPAVYGNIKEGSNGTVYSFKWNGKGTNMSNIRIYCVEENTDVAAIKDSDMVGIMHRGTPSPKKSDPYMLARHVMGDAKKRKSTPLEGDAPYLFAKLKEIPENIAVGRANVTLDITVPEAFTKNEPKPVKFYICGINSYGARSQLVPITMTDAKAAEEENTEEKTQ